VNSGDTSTSTNKQMGELIPPSKIANLSQGMFVGSVADNFGEKIDQKIFHVQIVVDNDRVAAETRAYQPIPVVRDFLDPNGNDILAIQIQHNYDRIKADVIDIIQDEFEEKRDQPGFKELWEAKMKEEEEEDC
jgi:hypothetical protein